MASSTLTTSLLTHIDSEDNVHFRFIWTLKKWSTCTLATMKGDRLESPHFWTSDKNNSAAEWYLAVYPKGQHPKEGTSAHLFAYLCLQALSSRGKKVNANCGIWIVSDDGTNNTLIGSHPFVFAARAGVGWPDSCDQVSRCIQGDTLTLMCKGTYNYEDSSIYENNLQLITWPDELMRCNIASLLAGSSSTEVITLSVSGREIHAHKDVLSKQSAAFREKLTNQSNGFVITIADHDFEVILEMVRFMYTGESFKLYSMADELLPAAIQYKVEDLQNMCETALIQKLNIENAIPTLTLVDTHSLHTLTAHVTNFISEHCEEIMQTDSWKELFALNPQMAYEINAMLMHKLNINK